MKEIELDKLVEIGLAQDTDWHFHFLTPDCIFNDSPLYKVILETKEGKFSSSMSHKPLEQLKKLENHFYGRK
ncbi:MAG: hypothetical protein A2664_02695 [Candidatus Taylorbacteria bacterium RIFCSPHIGHO2_01_FULL_46_22b]|uniref:Uncharacterized protein n=1 Tax=Candidatus Taylorbacteria bacterium RIFCSPHIGHO2_01_FULL_46_22b TaxID=1802301 RepID=A0A1G2M635_9BACT|nr:MAG: hypothetical protein A2664_02695 [Candidatus Taylorbacteria bacterium RIFCSPHIGHO2_01_FULL_46_22b]